MGRVPRLFTLLSSFPLAGFSWLGQPHIAEPGISFLNPGGSAPAIGIHSPFGEIDGTWSRSMLDTMSLEQKVGQLFIIPAWSKGDAMHLYDLDTMISRHEPGGVIFMQGSPARQRNLVTRLQEKSGIPLLISQDAEWGAGMRLDSILSFPRNMTLGAIRDDSMIYATGRAYGQQCKSFGVQLNFAPVVDVSSTPDNPGIHYRSFGEDAGRVAKLGTLIMQGMRKEKVIASAKHFPGKGDIQNDSPEGIPVLSHSLPRLFMTELLPFREMIAANLQAIVISHVYVPALTKEEGLPASLSEEVIGNLLRKDMGYRGLIISDALNGKAVTDQYAAGELELKALQAGNDILLFPRDLWKAKNAILSAIQAGEYDESRLNEHVLRILMAKEWAELHKMQGATDSVSGKAAKYYSEPTPSALVAEEVLRRDLYESAVTLVRNPLGILPLRDLHKRKIAHVQIGGKVNEPVTQTLEKYAEVRNFYLPKNSEPAGREPLLRELNSYNTIIVSILEMKPKARDAFGISGGTRAFLNALHSLDHDLILNVFGSPYSLKYFGHEDAIVLAYEDDAVAQQTAASVIFGGINPRGELPVTASLQFRKGTGFSFAKADGICFGIPGQEDLEESVMDDIDSIALAAIRKGGTPGCVVLVLKGNRIVFDRAYGTLEYGGSVKADPLENLYDLASVTKIAATTMAVMRLQDEGKISLDDSLIRFMPEFKNTNKSHITIRNLLLHNSGMLSGIAFYTETWTDSQTRTPDTSIFRSQPDMKFCIPVAEGMYMCAGYRDSMWVQIRDSRVRQDTQEVYSDLSMIVLGEIVSRIAGSSLDKYVDSVFYQPMGMNNTMFVPAMHGQGERCAPTEKDEMWRNSVTRGFVHDQSSAMFGGVSGNAGLFSNAYDLAKLLYCLKNGGSYNGVQYIDSQTVDLFTDKQNPGSRRGLGFDGHDTGPGKVSPCPPMASPSTFGHLGFTGIGTWVDPDNDLVYIFLSNRTYPRANNTVLLKENTRPNIMEVVYRAMNLIGE